MPIPGNLTSLGGYRVAMGRDVPDCHGAVARRCVPHDDRRSPVRGTIVVDTVIVTRDQLERSLGELRAQVPDPRAGILGPTSLAWRIGSDLGLFLGGGRAVVLQLAHPAVAFAIAEHSRTRSDVAGRFQRTFANVFAMIFGTLDEAFVAARRVHNVHARIHGTIPVDVGAWRAGAPYHANAVESLRWVHATLVDTTMVVREVLDGPLPIAIKDRYVAELARFAMLFGIPRAMIPSSYDEHAAYMRSMLAPGVLGVAPCAREMAGFLIGRGAAHVQPPLGRIGESVTSALLPAHLADAFGYRATPRRTRIGLAAFAAMYRRLPASTLRVPAAIEAHRRIARPAQPQSWWATWMDRQLLALAHRTTGVRV